MLKLVKELLLKLVDDIDTGNSNIEETQQVELVKLLQTYTDKSHKLSKYQACKYLNISRATFDNYVRAGILPVGKKEAGFKEKFWEKKDLDKFIKDRKNDNRKNI